MKLRRFRVTEFRSIQDSGWISIDKVTTLVGTNESGKTNLMIPLWKLNPTEVCPIDIILDMPRKKYHNLRNAKVKPVFITAHFDLSEEEMKKFSDLAGGDDISNLRSVYVGKNYDSEIFIEFSDDSYSGDFIDIVSEKLVELTEIAAEERYAKRREQIEFTVAEMATVLSECHNVITVEVVEALRNSLRAIDKEENVEIAPIRVLKAIINHKYRCMAYGVMEEIRKFVLAAMPKFVYYSSYGNIDSEIYLPQVIMNFQRENLGVKEAAKVRTLKMLFSFVKLDPLEIQALGKDAAKANLTPDQIEQLTRQKKEREILLQSASTEFTNRFKNWWKQGNYTFDFQADGDFFRIWVSDDVRRDKIELESRSTGLQWFFSFYLTFLTQSENKEQPPILLLDEPGLTLHPLAQEDLFNFFEGLSDNSQIIYSTHSPFMINSSHLSRVVSVYVDPLGNSVVSDDLRNSLRDSQSKSVYPVHAALNLLISDNLLNSCIPVIVNSSADQIYLNILKNYLISQGLIKMNRDIVFIPSSNVDGIRAVLPILVGRNTFMPYVVLAGDPEGMKEANDLVSDIYKNHSNLVFNVCGFGIENATVEDLVPSHIMEKMVVRFVPKSPYAEEEFEDVFNPKLSIVDQVTAFCNKHEMTMEKNWREALAKRIKSEIIKKNYDVYRDDKDRLAALTALFSKISRL